MVATNKTRNGVEDLDGEVLQGSHIDCATQVREYSREFRLQWRLVSNLQSGHEYVGTLRYLLYSPVR